MATKAYYKRSEIGPGKVGFSKTRSIIEGAFYGNNVEKITTLREAYKLAVKSPGTIVTDMPVYRGEEFGLDADAKVLLFNDGAITGRYAPARRITGAWESSRAMGKSSVTAWYSTDGSSRTSVALSSRTAVPVVRAERSVSSFL